MKLLLLIALFSTSAFGQGTVSSTCIWSGTVADCLPSDGLLLRDQRDLRLGEAAVNGSNYVAIQAPPSMSANTTLTLPADTGAANEVLSSTGASGILDWVPLTPITLRGAMIRGGVSGVPEQFVAETDNRVVRGNGTDVVSGQIDDPDFFTTGAAASSTDIGIVTTGTQSFAGVKTFVDDLSISTASAVLTINALGGGESNTTFSDNGTARWQIGQNDGGPGGTNGFFFFSTGYRGGINQAGNWYIGVDGGTQTHTIDGQAFFDGNGLGTSSPVLEVRKDNSTTSADGNYLIRFGVNGTTGNSGRISTNGANAAAFFSTSDRRLKEAIKSLGTKESLEKIKRLRPVNFKWKSDGSKATGFIAQELVEVIPATVSKTDDGKGEEIPKGVEPWAMTESGFIPYLVASIQEQQKTIEKLEQKIKALEEK